VKIISLPSGVNTIVSNEEQQLIELLQKSKGSMPKRKMDERQQQLAVDLVKRSVLTRAQEDGKIIYSLPPNDIWRI
jgi:hypothetical protein